MYKKRRHRDLPTIQFQFVVLFQTYTHLTTYVFNVPTYNDEIFLQKF